MSCNIMEDNNYWIGKKYSFFQNKECEFFPCHNGIKEEDFNCLFCFCPNYYNKNCEGNYNMIETSEGTIKDCSNCTKPHIRQNYGAIMNNAKSFMYNYFKYKKINITKEVRHISNIDIEEDNNECNQ